MRSFPCLKANLKRLPGKLLLVLIFFIGTLFYINSSDLRIDLELTLMVKVPHQDTFQLLINNKIQEININASNHFQKISFVLPREKIESLRVFPGQKPGIIAIQTLSVKNVLNSFQLKGKRLQKLFSQKSGVKRDYIKKQCYYLETIGSGYWLEPVKSFYQVIDRLQRNKILNAIIAVILSLFFFYLIHFINFQSFKRLFPLKPTLKGFLVFSFAIIIFFPLLDQVFSLVRHSQLEEKRNMAAKPEFKMDRMFLYLKEFTNYYNDNFTFRSDLIFLNNLIKVKLFNVSPTEKVLLGKNGWLFFDQPGTQPGTIDYYRSLTPFNHQQMEQWKLLLEQRQQWLAGRGIHYLFVIIPNKNTIYPEYMPDDIHRVNSKSRLDQLVEYLQNYSTVSLLDLRKALTEAKFNHPVYSKTDSHWSEYGAFIAHREIIDYVSRYFKGAEPLPISRFNIETDNHMGGDLAKMLSLHKEILRENIIRMKPSPPFTFIESRKKNISRYVKQLHTDCPTASLPPILMVHDSCYHRLKPFLSEKFSKVVYIWDWDLNFYPEIIKREKPKLVIDEIAERFLMDLSPAPLGSNR